MGSGKTTIGKILSKKLNIPFIDLDEYIEKKEQLSINEIFTTKGEIYFRKQEHLFFKELLQSRETFVLSLGGGTPCYANNHLLLQSDVADSFYLKAKVSTLVDRLKNEKENRPLLQTTDDLASYIGQHLFERVYYYNFAQYKINTDLKDFEIICNEIISLT